MKRVSCTLITALLALAVAGCELPAGDFTSPHYWGDLFLNKYAAQLVVSELEPGPEPLAEPRAVLLITGVTIPAQWFDPIVARLERDGFVPYVYEPPELLSGDLFDASEALADVVAQVREDSGQDRIDILAECTGGLIARHYVQSLGGEDSVSRLVTFVSPQNGVAKAPWAALIAGWPALHDLSPGSAFLKAVNGAPLPETVPITSIYTCSDEYIQPWQTSVIEGANNIGLCDQFVGHFQTFYDPEIYLIMHGALTEPTGFEPEPEPEEAPVEPPVEPRAEQTAEQEPETVDLDAETAPEPMEWAAETEDGPLGGAVEPPLGSQSAGNSVMTFEADSPANQGQGCTSASRGSDAGSGATVLFALGALLIWRRRVVG